MTKWVLSICAIAAALTACYIPDMSTTEDERIERGWAYRYSEWHPAVQESTAVVFDAVTQTVIAIDQRSGDWTPDTPLVLLVAEGCQSWDEGEGFVEDEDCGPLAEDYCYGESGWISLGGSSYDIPAMLDYWDRSGYEFATSPPSGEARHFTYRASIEGQGELVITHFVDNDDGQRAWLGWAAGRNCQAYTPW
jgi:hypothetical protein